MNYKTRRFMLLLTHLMICFVAAFCGNMRQNWSDLDLAALEEEWKSGDNKEDFEVTPDEELYQEFERRRKMAFAKVNAATNKANNIPKSHLNRLLIKAQTAGKPEIIMTKLKLDLSPEGKGWKWEALSEFCDDWSVGAHLVKTKVSSRKY
mmetsp:Transcript_59660/g.69723  ORF Transcript_59660/g.69723 Transcript_59660/m.69723 type:complete len:150 (-) Transcript_59660:285-734(-)